MRAQTQKHCNHISLTFDGNFQDQILPISANSLYPTNKTMQLLMETAKLQKNKRDIEVNREYNFILTSFRCKPNI